MPPVQGRASRSATVDASAALTRTACPKPPPSVLTVWRRTSTAASTSPCAASPLLNVPIQGRLLQNPPQQIRNRPAVQIPSSTAARPASIRSRQISAFLFKLSAGPIVSSTADSKQPTSSLIPFCRAATSATDPNGGAPPDPTTNRRLRGLPPPRLQKAAAQLPLAVSSSTAQTPSDLLKRNQLSPQLPPALLSQVAIQFSRRKSCAIKRSINGGNFRRP